MPAPKGNKYAEKITREVALDLAKKAYELLDDDCYFISDLADKCGVHRDKFSYILRKFEDDEEVYDALKRMYNKCEAIITKLAAARKIDVKLGIFLLKACHGLMETSKLYTGVEESDLEALYKKALSSNERESDTSN